MSALPRNASTIAAAIRDPRLDTPYRQPSQRGSIIRNDVVADQESVAISTVSTQNALGTNWDACGGTVVACRSGRVSTKTTARYVLETAAEQAHGWLLVTLTIHN